MIMISRTTLLLLLSVHHAHHHFSSSRSKQQMKQAIATHLWLASSRSPSSGPAAAHARGRGTQCMWGRRPPHLALFRIRRKSAGS
eukprot:7985773-Pyramimonas_sp.AAC.1